MLQIKPTRTVFTVSNFLDWQKQGTLILKPVFQRREVWSPKAKSLLIDTVVKGLPIPIIFLRKTQDLKHLTSTLEVVDGQQRLRTLFSFIDPTSLKDYDAARDSFDLLKVHNPDPDVANRSFQNLPEDIQSSLLEYEISTHVFPPNTDDEVVLRIFARLNSTGLGLNRQELRNAKFFGAFKTFVYELAIRNLALWRKWNVFSEDDFARMIEIESVSDYLAAMMNGIKGKSQPKLDKLYEEHDDKLKGASVLERKFEKVLESIDVAFGGLLSESRVRRQALFYSLFSACYDHIYGLASDYKKRRAAKALPSAARQRFKQMNERIATGNLPEKIQDAMEKATADTGRRLTRHKFFMESLGLEKAD